MLKQTNCKTCGIEFSKKESEIKKTNNHFCSRSCAAKFNNKIFIKRKKTYKDCINCNKTFTGNGLKYCSNRCQQDNIYKSKIEQWKLGNDPGWTTNGIIKKYIRKYILEKYNYQCSKCGWDKINLSTNKSPLEIHHIDGDHKNNTEENLILLCPNCHSLTDTYKNLNKGNGRIR